MKSKRVIAGLTSLLMFGSLAGCGAKTPDQLMEGSTSAAATDGAEGTTVSVTGAEVGEVSAATSPTDKVDFTELYGDETIQLTVFSQLANYSGKATGWFAEVMKREFNVEMTIIPDLNGAIDTRMESGNLGDIVIFGSLGDQYQRAATEGMLYNWHDDNLIDEYGTYTRDNMPYAMAYNESFNESIGAGSGQLYGLGYNVAASMDDHDAFIYTMDLRWDLYKELGYPEINNIDDLYDLFVEMKRICPKDENGNETYAISMWPDWDGEQVMYVKSFATCYWGSEGDMGRGHYDVETGDFYYVSDENSPYLRSLKFFNRLYQAGLIDPNSMTQTYSEMSEKVKAGGVFFSIFDYAGSQLYNDENHLNEGKGMYPMVPKDATPLCSGMNVLGGGRTWTIGANTEYPELCMAIINYLCTPEGYMTYWYGPKDLCWYYDDDGLTHFTELGESAYKDRKGTIMPDEWGGGSFNDGTFQANNTTWTKDAPNPDSNGETYNADNWTSRMTDTQFDIFQDWRDWSGQYNMQMYMDSLPHKVLLGTSYAAAKQSDELKIIWEQLNKCVTSYSWRAIYAKDDDEYDAIVAEMLQKMKEYDPEGLDKAECNKNAATRKALDEEARNR